MFYEFCAQKRFESRGNFKKSTQLSKPSKAETFITFKILPIPAFPHQKPQTIHQVPNQFRGQERPLVGAVEFADAGMAIEPGSALRLDGDEVGAVGEDVGWLGVVEAVVGVVDGAAVRDGLHVGHVA